ncbi:aspartate/glutamate racemase family protein [Verticiella sediminum]
MVPANNTTMEGEMLGWLPPGSTCRTLRVPRGNGLLTAETLPAYKAAAVELAARFDRDTLDVIAYGCTAAGFILGPEGDAGIAADLARVTGKPVVTTASAMVHALQQAGARRINVLTPYLDDVNERIRRFLAAGGIDVERLDSFLAPDVQALGRITAEQVRARAEPLLEPDVDALFIACSQLPTLSVIAPLAERFGKPVLSSIQVTAQRAMQYVP